MKNKVPKLRFKEFTDEWEEKRLGEVLFERKIKQKISEIAPLLAFAAGQGVIDRSERKTNNRDFLTKDSTQKKYLLTKYNDIVYNPSNLKYGAIDRNKYGQGVISPIYVTFETSEIPSFIELIVKSENFKQKALQYEEGTVTKRQSVKPENLLSLNIIKPDLKEQEKIASFLSKVDESIEILEEEKELWEKYKKGMMQKIFSQKLRFKDENGNDYPEWEEKRLEEVLTIGNGKDYKHLNEGDVPVFGTGGYMTSVDKYLYDGETVFIGRKGTINKPFYYNGKFWTVDTLFYTHNFKNSLPKFIYVIFQNVDWLQYNEASGVPSLSKSTINNIFINLPSLPEQEKIANLLSTIDEKIELIEKELEEIKEFKKGLLQKMFV
ncbi:restriction endonuclease subunit S [Cetobacterium somerae]|uniref:restriction endonuclease subunit S n=1 Tax=Cetobacterium sp. NK01 TaxID=2993530 RepID=UPI0021162027|nr:restriction endonuclease subunit S [Cetobacterium sp. NK01]MCQ8213725.1 restriction endonuclease subunit S [Cetobacterium sp. NK01]